MSLLKCALIAAFLFLPNLALTQPYVRANETIIFSFKTTRGKHVYLIRDKESKYAAYRFGTASKIEFEYPTAPAPARERFEYAFYLRGGGPRNAGMDLNYVSFENAGYRYVIYDTYFAESSQRRIGVKVTDLRTSKTTDFPGVYSSRKGTMIDLRDMNLMAEGDELFD